jgi:hypothetical protein
METTSSGEYRQVYNIVQDAEPKVLKLKKKSFPP